MHGLSGISRSFRLTQLILLGGWLVAPAYGTVSLTSSNLSSIGTPVSFEADLTISGNTLTVQLWNTSPVSSLGPNDTIGSFYFDIVDGGNNRPTLTYVSAVGDVYLASRNNPDTLQTAGANLKAVAAADNTWQFKAMNAGLAPFLGFGLGTVGNNNLTPNNFSGNVVDGFDYSIVKGDVTTQNLDNTLLVKGPITFTFSGVSGFAEADVINLGAFGLGTAPDSVVTTVPEPGSLFLLSLGVLGLLGRHFRRRG